MPETTYVWVTTRRSSPHQPVNTDQYQGDTWDIDASGVLTVYKTGNSKVASYASGQWLTVSTEQPV